MINKEFPVLRNAHAIEMAEQLVDILKKINKSFKIKILERSQKLGLTVSQYAVISQLISTPEITLNELSHYLQSTSSTVSGIIDRLVEKGIVIRKTPKENRRIVGLSVSEEYMTEHNFEGMKQDIVLEIVKGNPKEMESIISGLEKFYFILGGKTEVESAEE